MRILLRFIFFIGTLVSISSAVRCPGKDWYYRKGTNKCYYVISKTPVQENGPTATNRNFTSAITECKIRGGKLVTFDDAEEFEWVNAKLGPYTWYWIGLTYENLRWQWFDGDNYRDYSQIAGLTIPDFGSFTNDADKVKKRISLYSGYQSDKFKPTIESSSVSNGYICKGDWSGRPWCKIEDGWRYHDGRCIRYYPKMETFDDARLKCSGDAGYIIVPSTQTEDDLYKAWLRDTMRVNRGWMGIMIDKKSTGTTVDSITWLDGTPITATNISNWVGSDLVQYISSLPNNTQKFCGEMYTKSGGYVSGDSWDYWDLGLWVNETHDWVFRNNCMEAKPFACEAPLNKCPYGWKEWGNQCYQMNLGEDRLRTWSEARDDCIKQKGDLVVIQNADVQKYLITMTYTNYDPLINVQHQYWIGLNGSGQSFTWVNSTQPLAVGSYQAWTGGKAPQVTGPTCVYMNGDLWLAAAANGDWNATLCTQKMGYICEALYTADIPPLEVVYPTHTCLAPFEKFHEGCYLQVKEKKNRDAAQAHCQERQSVLAYPVTFGENLWLQGKVDKEDSWLGLRIVDKTPEGTRWKYEYSNGNAVGSGAYTRWDDSVQSAQNDPRFDKFCAALAGTNSTYNISTWSSFRRPDKGYWYHLPCTELREFICYHPGEPIIKPPTDSNNDPLCGAGWFRIGSNCYQIYDAPVPWRLAKQTCQNIHADSDLITITTREENNFMTGTVHLKPHYPDFDLINNNLTNWNDLQLLGPYPTNYWLGLYSEKNNDWHWPFRGSSNKWHIPLALTNWASAEPIINVLSAQKPRCAYIRKTALGYPRWHSADCGESHPFLCKKVLSSTYSSTSTPTPKPTASPGQVMGCPSDAWSMFHGRCIHFTLQTADWRSAHADCLAKKGDLVTIHNQEEFDEIKHFGTSSWNGLNSINDTDGPRIFSWSNGKPLTFSIWDTESASSSVSGITDVNCGALTTRGFSMYSCSQKRSYVCEMPLQSVNPSTDLGNPTDVPGCFDGAYAFNTSCYHFGETPNTNTREFYNFQDANNFCKNNYAPTGTLVVVDSVEEQRFIDSHVSRFGSEFWIGLKQNPNPWEAFSHWITTETVAYTNWGPNQPSSVAGEGCVAITGSYSDEALPGDWYVDSCRKRKYALCEVKRSGIVPTPPALPTTPRPTGCPAEWKTSSKLNFCYKGYVGKNTGPVVGVTWQVAEDFCKNFRTGHLISITSEEEQNFADWQVQPMFSSGMQFWIGLREMTYQTEVRWGWADGSPLTVNNFHPNMNHSNLEELSCVALESMSGDWIPQNCQQSYGWMCKIQKGAYAEGAPLEDFPTASPINTTCGEATEAGEWYFDQTVEECVYFSKQTNTWSGAKEDCLRMDAHLVTILDKNHHDWISMKSSQLAGYQSGFYWIGLYQVDSVGEQFAWDGDHISLFRAWEAGQPDPRGIDRCVAQNTRSGLWRDLNCGMNYRYICAKHSHENHVRPSQQPTHAPDVGNCPTGWLQHRHTCYYIAEKEQESTWDEAHVLCNQQALHKSDLVSIRDRAENDFLLSQMKGRNGSSFWIGLNKFAEDNSYSTWGWSDNSPLRFLNWHFNEPPYYGTSTCIEFLSSKRGGGRWSAISCMEKRPFICKASKDPNAPPQPTVSTKCPQGYTEFEGNCFLIQELDEGKDNWNEAQKKCRSIPDGHGDLATVSDIYENAMLHSMLSEHHLKGNHTHRAWIGMKEHFGNFAWDNTCPVVFSNFMDLSQRPTATSCVSLGVEGKWRSVDCDETARYAICERRLAPCPAVHQQSDYDYCPVNFPSECTRSCYRIDVPMSQHAVDQTAVSYKEAKGRCEKLGGHLASIRTEDDQKCLEKYLETAYYNLWIGLYATINEEGQSVWRWLESGLNSEEAVTFLNWGLNQPDNIESQFRRKECGQIMPNGTWINAECDMYYGKGFLCESRKIQRSTSRKTTRLPPAFSTTVSTERSASDGLTDGQTAGIVIGVFLAVGLVGGAAFIVKTGRTNSVLASVRSAGSAAKNAATIRMKTAGFVNRNYEKHEESQRTEEDPAVLDHS